MLDKFVRRLFDYVEGYRKVSDHDDESWFQSWERGIVKITDSHDYVNHSNYMTCEIVIFGMEVFWASGRGSYGGKEKLSLWLFGHKVMDAK